MTSPVTIILAVVLILHSGYQNVCGMHLEPTPRNLSCYSCITLRDGISCKDVQLNNTHMQASCEQNQMYCSVRVFRYSGDSPDLKFWSVERKCEEKCQEGCIIVGERVKLYLCRTCCTGYLCNHGNSARRMTVNADTVYLILLSLFLSFVCVLSQGRTFPYEILFCL